MAGGVAGWLLVAPLVGATPGEAAIGIPMAAFASLLADTDHHNAILGRNLLARAFVQSWTKHRYETHSLFAAGVVTAPFLFAALWIGPWLAGAVAAGYVVGHIFLDWCTVQGVALLWPWRWRLYRAPWAFLVRTNRPSEYVMVFFLALAWAALAYWRTA